MLPWSGQLSERRQIQRSLSIVPISAVVASELRVRVRARAAATMFAF
jgi:hypothetical protein